MGGIRYRYVFQPTLRDRRKAGPGEETLMDTLRRCPVKGMEEFDKELEPGSPMGIDVNRVSPVGS